MTTTIEKERHRVTEEKGMLDNGMSSGRMNEIMSHAPRAHRRSRSSNYATMSSSSLPHVTRYDDDLLQVSLDDTYTVKQSARLSNKAAAPSSWKRHIRRKSSATVLPLVSPRCRDSAAVSNLALYNKQIYPFSKISLLRLAAAISLCAVIPWLYSRGGGEGGMYYSNHPTTGESTTVIKQAASAEHSVRGATTTHPAPSTTTIQAANSSAKRQQSAAAAAAATAAAAEAAAEAEAAAVKCDNRKKWHEPSASTPTAGLRTERAQCSRVLPASVLETEGWLLAVHIDRASTTQASLRLGRQQDRLPHQYFVRVVDAALAGIADAEAGATVDVVVFSEGCSGGLVDEVGMGVEWDVPREVCRALGLTCTQVRVNCVHAMYQAFICHREGLLIGV